MEKKEPRIKWAPDGDGDRKIYAINKEGECLGSLEYEMIGAHMHWCWYQLELIRMSPGCLEEVRLKQKELFNLKRSK